MTPDEFVIWLRGFVDFANPQEIDKDQWQKIRTALDSVSNTNKVGSYFGSSIYTNPIGKGILSCSLQTKTIGFKL